MACLPWPLVDSKRQARHPRHWPTRTNGLSKAHSERMCFSGPMRMMHTTDIVWKWQGQAVHHFLLVRFSDMPEKRRQCLWPAAAPWCQIPHFLCRVSLTHTHLPHLLSYRLYKLDLCSFAASAPQPRTETFDRSRPGCILSQ
jgi:hypothetical protein